MSPNEIIERESRRARIGAVAGSLAFVFYLASLVLIVIDSPSGDGVIEALTRFAADYPIALVSQGLAVAAYIGLGVILWLLIDAVRARNPAVPGYWRGVIVFGITLIATSGIVFAVAKKDVGDQLAKLPAPQLAKASALEKLELTLENDEGAIDGEIYFIKNQDIVEYQLDDGKPISVAYPMQREQELIDAVDATDVVPVERDDARVGELVAQNLTDDSDLIKTAKTLGLPSLLAFGAALFYTSRMSLRAGLLGRFWGTFGMAAPFGLALPITVLASLGIFGFAAYSAAVMAGWPFVRRPPAWDEGIAIPWDPVGPDPSNARPSEPESADPEMFSSEGGPSRTSRSTNRRKRKRKQRGN